jgi:hypothetical protein
MRFLLFPLFLLTLLSPAYSQDLAKAKLTYKEQKALITLKHDVERAKLKSALGKALDDLMAKYKAAGNSSAWRAAEGAANALNSGTILEPTGTPLVDQNLAVYNRKASTIDDSQDQKTAGLNDAYKKRLGELITVLTKAGKRSEAEAAEFELKRFMEMHPNQPRAPIDKAEAPVVHKGHRYLFIPEKVTWKEALALAVKMNGHLVYINDAEENKFVLDYVGQHSSSIWLGAELIKKRFEFGPSKRPDTTAVWKAPHLLGPLTFWPNKIDFKEDERLYMICQATQAATRRNRRGRRVKVDPGHGRWQKSDENALRHAVIEWDK